MTTIGESDVLIAADVQNDFCSGGALAVPDGDAVVPVINSLGRRFGHLVVTQDWHPPDHQSFASQHPGRKPFEAIRLGYGDQTLWPDHCVAGTWGADLHSGFDLRPARLIIRKGFRPEIDSYSAFRENDRATSTGLGGYLRAHGVTRVFLAGLATDYCVGFSALDAVAEGFQAVLIEDACRAIDVDGSLAAMISRLTQAGVGRITSASLA
jgi:nicotinamidase/pyrazinamidase